MTDFLWLLAGTVIHRPYVYAFFLCFIVFGWKHMGARGTASFTALSFLIAFLSEYSSTRNGFPFGFYVYIEDTRSRELWISNVPFWDSLSFVFLSYFSWILAASVIEPGRPSSALLRWRTTLLTGLLMMLLDVVIDPVTLQGDRWFLGRIYFYPEGGAYFGVTLANFMGWFLVGAAIPFSVKALAQGKLTRKLLGPPEIWTSLSREAIWVCFLLYSAVFVFNVAIAVSIGRWDIFFASLVVASGTLGSVAYALTRKKKAPARRTGSYPTLERTPLP